MAERKGWQQWLHRWLALCVLVMTTGAFAATPFTTIAQTPPPAEGIQEIYVGNDLSAQVKHTIDASRLQVYPASAIPGDFGTIVFAEDTLFAPDFANHAGTATGNLGARTPYTPISQSAVSGNGSSATPFVVSTTVALTGKDLEITQKDSFVNGNEFFSTDVTLKNVGATNKTVIVYRALDCYLGGSDSGYGFEANGSIACAKNANNNPPDRLIQLIPLTPGSAYLQNGYNAVWGAIGTHQMFGNQCAQCSSTVDNGAGLSWSVTVPAGGTATVSNITLFSPTGKLPVKVTGVAVPSTLAAGGQTTYTVTLQNPNTSAVTLNSVEDVLPAGFSYIPGSTTGAVSTDPTVAGSTLTWATPVVVPLGGAVSFNLSVNVAPTVVPGTYTSALSGVADGGYSVQGDAVAAPVIVTAYGMQPLTVTATVSPASVKPGDQANYTLTITNPNPLAANLDTLTQELPTDFAYMVGSTSSGTTTDPAVAGQLLTWSGPFW